MQGQTLQISSCVGSGEEQRVRLQSRQTQRQYRELYVNFDSWVYRSMTVNELDFHLGRTKRINRCIPTRLKPHQNKTLV